MGVLHLAALPEQRVRFVEEQDGAAGLRSVEQSSQVLLGFADVLVDHRRQVDAMQVEPQVVGDHLGGHRLAGAAGAGEQCADAQAAADPVGEAPAVVHGVPVSDLVCDLVQCGELFGGQHDVVPADG